MTEGLSLTNSRHFVCEYFTELTEKEYKKIFSDEIGWGKITMLKASGEKIQRPGAAFIKLFLE